MFFTKSKAVIIIHVTEILVIKFREISTMKIAEKAHSKVKLKNQERQSWKDTLSGSHLRITICLFFLFPLLCVVQGSLKTENI